MDIRINGKGGRAEVGLALMVAREGGRWQGARERLEAGDLRVRAGGGRKVVREGERVQGSR